VYKRNPPGDRVDGGVDERADLTSTQDRTGEHGLSRLAGGRQRLTGQCRLVDLDLVAVQQARVRGDDVSEAQPDHVAGHQLTCGRRHPLPVASDARSGRQLGLQRVDGVSRLMLLGVAHDSVRDEQHQDDGEVSPVLDRT